MDYNPEETFAAVETVIPDALRLYRPPTRAEAPRAASRHLDYAYQMLSALKTFKPEMAHDQTFCLALEHLKSGAALVKALHEPAETPHG